MIKFKAFNLLLIANLISVGLPLKEDIKLPHRQQSEAYLVENSLQPSEQDVPLEDFFWTGSGDGPLYVNHPSSVGTKYPTIVRTATILATVFIDGNFEEFDPLCVYDCDKKGDGSGIVESIDRVPPSDRRYWLLTVVAGLFSAQDFPILEEKLAKLYRIAFLRQQANHLGIVNGNATATKNQTKSEEPVTRKKRFASEISPTKTLNASEEIRTRRFEINKHVYERQVLRMKRHRVPVKREAPPPPSKPPINLKLPAPYEIIYMTDDKSKNKKLKSNHNFMQKVSVMIHKLDHDEEEGSDTNRIETDLTNHTEIIYSVIVGGRPVLALTAAEDMKLVSTDEVRKIMENDIVLKAEPYLREPMATPSVASQGEEDMKASYISQSPMLIALSIIALILFILLLLTLLLYGRSKRRLAAEEKLQSATQALVEKISVDDDINTIRSNSIDIGVENLAFEKESKEDVRFQKKQPPVLTFPLPPPNRPSSSTSSTSDSSVYYPKRRYKFSSIQDLLDDKSENIDEIYTKLKSSTAKSTSRKKDISKVHKNRHRRKHQNRVGSVEQTNAASDADIGYDDSLMHNEAFNPHVSQYNANKLMTDKTFTVIESERTSGKSRLKKSSGGGHVEAINQELLHLQKGRVASAETNSIGSFLSMASIRSFPKCSVPEPLNRILEPVSVTHLDHSDADYETLKNYRMMDSQKSLDDIDSRTQSDGADPGFVGPIVWELHKKGLDTSTNSLGSPLRDAHATRNRFEGLLEGAMKLYSSSSYSNCHSLMHQQEDDQLGQMPGVIKSREARGKSAATIRLTSRTSGLLSRADFHPTRPKTADQPDIQPQNLLPTIHAWSSGSGANLRPMSAGIYHKPDGSIAEEIKRIDRSRAMSASPIIDAIQEELKRISNEKL